MCEIIRNENGGDLTYFLQYYLELLVRALDVRNERARRREQEALEREREMAREPLRHVEQPAEQLADHPQSPPEDCITREEKGDDDPDRPPRRPPGTPEHDTEDALTDADNDTDVKTSDPGSPFVNKAVRMLPPVPLMEPEKYMEAVNKMRASRYPNIRVMPDKISRVLERHVYRFTAAQWAEIQGTDVHTANYECRYMYEKGWMTRERGKKAYVYALRVTVANSEQSDYQPEDECRTDERDLETILTQMERSKSTRIRGIAAMVRRMRAGGITSFTSDEVISLAGVDKEEAHIICDYLISHRLVRNLQPQKRKGLFAFTDLASCEEADIVPVAEPDEPPDDTAVSMMRRYEEMASSAATEWERRVGTVLAEILRQGKAELTISDIIEISGQPEHTSKKLMTTMVNLGLVCKTHHRDRDKRIAYSLRAHSVPTIRYEDLTFYQKEVLTALYTVFPNRAFTVNEGAAVCKANKNSFIYHMKNFKERGILVMEHVPGRENSYRFAADPLANPECFFSKNGTEQIITSSGAGARAFPLVAAGV